MERNSLKISEEEMLEALNRSGYILESEIVKQLSDLGYFVESNLITIDPLTGKNREIDIYAEYFDRYGDNTEKRELKLVAGTRFVFEVKNNTFPLVLLTEFKFSPSSDAIDSSLKIASTKPSGSSYLDYMGHSEYLISDRKQKIFTQYCSFSKKSNKDELMASHPENVYSDIVKISHYCEEIVDRWNSRDSNHNEEYLRNFLYLPVLLINDNLYELSILSKGKKKLRKVLFSKLVFGYKYKDEPRVAIIYVVTKSGFKKFLNMMYEIDMKVENMMLESKKMDLAKK